MTSAPSILPSALPSGPSSNPSPLKAAISDEHPARAIDSGRRRIALAALAAALCFGAATVALHAWAAAPAAAPGAAKPALTVTAVQALPAQLVQAVRANGSIAPWQEAIIGAEAQGLRLAEVRVNVGDRVRRGQVLATFASDIARAELAQSQAALVEAEATLAEAASNAARARELAQSGALSAQQINQMLTQERTAQARLEALRAGVQLQRLRLAQSQVLAPDDGVISARNATVGAVVPAGQELFRLIRQGRLEWRAEVVASELALLQPGQSVSVVPAGGPTIVGKVRMLAPTVDPSTRNGLVYVDLPQPGQARAGMFARGEFAVGESAAMTLPQSAVLLRDGFAYVFRIGPDNKVARVKVTTGRRVDERIEIVAGLEPRARVVHQGAGFLADGDLVRVVDAPAAAAAPRSPAPPATALSPAAPASRP